MPIKPATIVKKIEPCLWFDTNAAEAVEFYKSVFPESETLETTYYGENAPLPAGTVLTISFRLGGEKFLALNGGSMFKFSPAISFVIYCRDQNEIDYYWERLTDGGEARNCGWALDKFGLSWQIVPEELDSLMNSDDLAKSQRVMNALLGMYKIEVAGLKRAFEA